MYNTVFIGKKELNWWQYVRVQLHSIEDLSLPVDAEPGSCTICFESNYRNEIELIYNMMPELMVRMIERGRPDDPDNGELLCRVRLVAQPRMTFSNEGMPYKIRAIASVLEWESDWRKKFPTAVEILK